MVSFIKHVFFNLWYYSYWIFYFIKDHELSKKSSNILDSLLNILLKNRKNLWITPSKFNFKYSLFV